MDKKQRKLDAAGWMQKYKSVRMDIPSLSKRTGINRAHRHKQSMFARNTKKRIKAEKNEAMLCEHAAAKLELEAARCRHV